MTDTPVTMTDTPVTVTDTAAPVIALGNLVSDGDRHGIYLGKDADGNDLVSWLPEPSACVLDLNVEA